MDSTTWCLWPWWLEHYYVFHTLLNKWELFRRYLAFTNAIALGYGLDDRGSKVRFPAGAGNFSLHHRVQNGSGAHPASCPVGSRGAFPGVKRLERVADHSSPSVPRSRMRRAVPPFPQYVFIAWCLVKHTDNFTLPYMGHIFLCKWQY
jgi:hypothetical protein